MIKKLYELLKNDKIVKESMFKNKNLDELLNLRDETSFDDKWITVFNILEGRQDETMDIELLHKIREVTYIKTYRLTQSSDLAACVSDDFEIIVKAFVFSYNDEWLNSLAQYYQDGNFPCGELSRTSLSIQEIMERFLLIS